MKATKQPSFRRVLSVALLALTVGLAAGAVASDREIFDERVSIRKLDDVQVKSMVEQALPTWDSKVLAASDGTDWVAKTSFSRVLSAVEDQSKATAETGSPRLDDGERAIIIDWATGKVRYTSKARRWTFKQASMEPVAPQQALDLAVKSLTALGLPREEIGRLKVDTQVALGASKDTTATRKRYKMYRLVSVGRRINSLPVYKSRSRVAVTNQGTVQRLKINWPTFRLQQGLALRSREMVVDQIVKRIMLNTPNAELKVKGYLAYAFPTSTRTPETSTDSDLSVPSLGAGRDADDTDTQTTPTTGSKGPQPVGAAVPVMIVSVYSGPTPFQIVMPVADAR